MASELKLRRFTHVGGGGLGWAEDCDDGELCDADEVQTIIDTLRTRGAELEVALAEARAEAEKWRDAITGGGRVMLPDDCEFDLLPWGREQGGGDDGEG